MISGAGFFPPERDRKRQHKRSAHIEPRRSEKAFFKGLYPQHLTMSPVNFSNEPNLLYFQCF